MTWISGIQRVLDYIEENLDGDICYDEMTKLSGSVMIQITCKGTK